MTIEDRNIWIVIGMENEQIFTYLNVAEDEEESFANLNKEHPNAEVSGMFSLEDANEKIDFIKNFVKENDIKCMPENLFLVIGINEEEGYAAYAARIADNAMIAIGEEVKESPELNILGATSMTELEFIHKLLVDFKEEAIHKYENSDHIMH